MRLFSRFHSGNIGWNFGNLGSKLETAISKNRQQYDQLTKELKELLEKKKALQSEELMKAIADSPRSYEDILRYIKGSLPEEED